MYTLYEYVWKVLLCEKRAFASNFIPSEKSSCRLQLATYTSCIIHAWIICRAIVVATSPPTLFSLRVQFVCRVAVLQLYFPFVQHVGYVCQLHFQWCFKRKLIQLFVTCSIIYFITTVFSLTIYLILLVYIHFTIQLIYTIIILINNQLF